MDQWWDETQGIIHMDNAAMFAFLNIIDVEEGHDISPFCCYLRTKYDLRVAVYISPLPNRTVRSFKTEYT